MGKTIVLTGTAVVSFRKVIHGLDDEVEELVSSNDLREAQINNDDLRDIEWIHDDVDFEVIP